jgi:tetratricopeptide (TPR) repeat protein
MSHETSVQPKLGDLLANYLSRRAANEAEGLAQFDSAEVLPYEAGPVQPIDPKLAWDGARSAIDFFSTHLTAKSWKTPPQWSFLVSQHEPEAALPICVGNFPQMVRNFHILMQQAQLSDLRPRGGRPVPASELIAWADQTQQRGDFADSLLALAGLRLAKQWDRADALVAALEAKVPDTCRNLWDNEKAALAWHRGRAEEAMELWQVQNPSLAVRFNRGMARLFLGHTEAARKELANVVAEFPENGAWHHLARLYLALAQLRRD